MSLLMLPYLVAWWMSSALGWAWWVAFHALTGGFRR